VITMTARFNAGWAVALPIIVSFGSVLCGSAKADPLELNQVPVSNAIAKLDKVYGISIVISGTVNPRTPVSFSVDDTSEASYPLFAVNSLANSLGLDFQKSFVISKVADASGQPGPRMDTNSDVIFADNKVDAASAIEKVAMLDGATVQFTDSVTGTVNLTDTDLKAKDAAGQLAQLTHTHWEAVYTLYSRSVSPTAFGKVVDRTNEGQPIVQLPFATYVYAPPPAPAPKVVVDTTKPASAAPTGAPETAVTQPAQTPGVVPTAPYANPYGYPYQAQYGGQYAYPYGYQSYDPYSGQYDNQYTDPNYTPYNDTLDSIPLYNSDMQFSQPYPGGPMIFGNGSLIIPSRNPFGVTVLR
jgi:hypothetical protein